MTEPARLTSLPTFGSVPYFTASIAFAIILCCASVRSEYYRADLLPVDGDVLLAVQTVTETDMQERVDIYRRAEPGNAASIHWEVIFDKLYGVYYGAVVHKKEAFLFFENTILVLSRQPGAGPWQWRRIPLLRPFLPEAGISADGLLYIFGKEAKTERLAGVVYHNGVLRDLPRTTVTIPHPFFQMLAFDAGGRRFVLWRPQTAGSQLMNSSAFSTPPEYVELLSDGRVTEKNTLSLDKEGMLNVQTTADGESTTLLIQPSAAPESNAIGWADINVSASGILTSSDSVMVTPTPENHILKNAVYYSLSAVSIQDEVLVARATERRIEFIRADSEAPSLTFVQTTGIEEIGERYERLLPLLAFVIMTGVFAFLALTRARR
ncbi:MAG: hypothetical protein ABIH86_00880 [Planctomycetota bacterium]